MNRSSLQAIGVALASLLIWGATLLMEGGKAGASVSAPALVSAPPPTLPPTPTWRLTDGQDSLLIAGTPVLTVSHESRVDGPSGRSFPGCGGIREAVPSPDGRWLLVTLQCFSDDNTVLIFQANGVRWGQIPGWSFSAMWIDGGRAVQRESRVELSPNIERHPGGEMQITHRVTGVRSDDVLNVRQRPRADAPIVGLIPPDARGILVEKEDGVFMEGYFEGTGWMQIVWGDMVGWANGRYLQAVLGERKR